VKQVLFVSAGLLLLLLLTVPTGEAGQEWEAKVEEPPRLPLTVVGTQFKVNDSIVITIRVTNTGTMSFAADTDVYASVLIDPDPTDGVGTYVAEGEFGVDFPELPPTSYVDLKTPSIPLNYTGTYTVKAFVWKDWDMDGIYDIGEEISNIAEDTFTVETEEIWIARVEILSIQAAVIGAFGALMGLLVGTRIWS